MDKNTLKTDTASYWGALAKLPQIDAIFRACEELEESQKPVNRETVKECSGVTFNNLLATGIKLYRERQEETQCFSNTPSVLLHLVGQALEKAFTTVQKDYESQLSVVDNQYQEVVSGAAKDMADLQLEVKKTHELLQEKESQLALLIEDKALVVDSLTQADKRYESLETKYNQVLGEQRELNQQLNDEKNRRQEQMADHRLAMEALAQENAAHTKLLTDQQDKAYDYVMTQLGNERSQWKNERLQFDNKLKRLKSDISTKQSELDRSIKEISILNHSLSTKTELETQLTVAEDKILVIQEQLSALEKVEQENTFLQTELDRLNNKLSARSSLVKQLPGLEQFEVMQRQLSELHEQISGTERDKKNALE